MADHGCDDGLNSGACSCSCAKQVAELSGALSLALDRLSRLEAKVAAKENSNGEARQKPDKVTKPTNAVEISPVSRGPAELPMAATRVIMQQICLPLHCDTRGRCFGGQVLSWIDMVAGYAAFGPAQGPIVTASVDAVHFLSPILTEHIVVLEALVNCTFSSSMEVGVSVFDEDPSSGKRLLCCQALLTFVSLNSVRKPEKPDAKPLPRLVAAGKEQEDLMAAAASRRQGRLEKRKAAAGKQKMETTLPPTNYRKIAVPNTSLVRAVSKGDLLKKQTLAPGDTLSHMTQLVMPQDANPGGITFGGQVLSWVEQAAYLSAARLSAVSGQMLTAAMDAVSFREPTKVGDLLFFASQVTATFQSSVEVIVSVYAESPLQGNMEPRFVLDAFVTLVCSGPDGMPQPLPFSLRPSDPLETRRMEEALERKQEQKKMREALHGSAGTAAASGLVPAEDVEEAAVSMPVAE